MKWKVYLAALAVLAIVVFALIPDPSLPVCR